MKLFPCGHATHPQWRMAAGLVLAQLRAQMSLPDYASQPRLGLLYITDHYAPEAQALLDHLLCACSVDQDEVSGEIKCSVVAPDYNAYYENVKRYGNWMYENRPEEEQSMVEDLFGTKAPVVTVTNSTDSAESTTVV